MKRNRSIGVRSSRPYAGFLCRTVLSAGLLLTMVLWPWAAQAQDLSDYLQVAAENNPELKSRYENYMASMEKVAQVGTLPDPTVTFGFFVQDMVTLMGNQKLDMSLMQMFPWFGMLQTQKDEASLMAKTQYEAFKVAKNELFFQVKQTYFQLYLLDQDLAISHKNLEILQTIERLAITRLQGGDSQSIIQSISSKMKDSGAGGSASSSGMNMGEDSGATQSPSKSRGGGMTMNSGASGKMTDILQIQIQRKDLEAQLDQLVEDRKVMQTKFNLLLNRDVEDTVVVEEAIMDREMLERQGVVLDSILTSNPMLKMLDAESEAFRKRGEMAKLEGRPMFGVGVEYMRFQARSPQGNIGSEMGYTPGGMGGNMVMPMVSVSLPIYRKKYKASFRESVHYREAAEYQKENYRNQLQVELEGVYRDLRQASRDLDLYREQVNLLERTMRLMVTAYANADGSMEDLLKVQQQLLEYELKQSASKVEKQTAIAMLEMLMARGI